MTVEFGYEVRIYYERLNDEEGLRQIAVADDVGMSQNMFSQIMNGHRDANPTIAEGLVRVLKVPPEKQVRFLLLAAGYSEKVTEGVLKFYRVESAGIDSMKPKMDLIRKLQNFLEDESI